MVVLHPGAQGAQGSARQPPAGSQNCVHIADFWDTAGQERFQSMHASYYHKAHACIMVRDQLGGTQALGKAGTRGPAVLMRLLERHLPLSSRD